MQVTFLVVVSTGATFATVAGKAPQSFHKCLSFLVSNVKTTFWKNVET